VTFTNPQANRLVGVPLGVPLHPTQLYESLAEALIFTVLFWRFGKPHRPGSILSLYLVLYGITRFLVEFVRFHDPQSNPLTGPFTTGSSQRSIADAVKNLELIPVRDLTRLLHDVEGRHGEGEPKAVHRVKEL